MATTTRTASPMAGPYGPGPPRRQSPPTTTEADKAMPLVPPGSADARWSPRRLLLRSASRPTPRGRSSRAADATAPPAPHLRQQPSSRDAPRNASKHTSRLRPTPSSRLSPSHLRPPPSSRLCRARRQRVHPPHLHTRQQHKHLLNNHAVAPSPHLQNTVVNAAEAHPADSTSLRDETATGHLTVNRHRYVPTRRRSHRLRATPSVTS